MSILITGASGQLGLTLQQVFSTENVSCPVLALNKDQCDITDRKLLQKIFKEYQPQWVLNTAAFTAVDLAETQQQQAFDLNVEAVRYLAQECERTKSKLIHFSTDYVFSGHVSTTTPQPYVETSVCDPLSVYGKTKWLGEQAIQDTFDNYIILRVSWLFSPYGKNFVKTIIRLLQEKESLKIINDQYGSPTFTYHVAHIIKTIMHNYSGTTGIFHYCDQPSTTWYHFANCIQDYFIEALQHKNLPYLKKDIFPISTAEYPTPAIRPAYSVLSCEKIKQTMGIEQSDWRQGIPLVSDKV